MTTEQSGATMRLASIVPTPLYARAGDGLNRAVDLTIANSGAAASAEIDHGARALQGEPYGGARHPTGVWRHHRMDREHDRRMAFTAGKRGHVPRTKSVRVDEGVARRGSSKRTRGAPVTKQAGSRAYLHADERHIEVARHLE